MRFMKWIGLMAVMLLVVSCFTPWVFIESKSIIVSGIDSTGTNFGKPGYFHFLFSFFFILFHFIKKIWAKKWNLLVVALNISWAIRNFIIITICRAGDCPEKKAGMYMVLLASAIMFLSALFPDIEIKEEKEN